MIKLIVKIIIILGIIVLVKCIIINYNTGN